MSRATRKPGTPAPKPEGEARRATDRQLEGVAARAVKTTRGKAATTVDVELDPGCLAPPDADPQAVVAQHPSIEDDAGAVRWDDQPLEKAGESSDGSRRTLRYRGTRYEGSDAGALGIKVRVQTSGGTVTKDGIAVSEAGKPDVPSS